MSWLSPPADYDIVKVNDEPVYWLGTTTGGDRVRITDAESGGIPNVFTRASRVDVLHSVTGQSVVTALPGSLHAARIWIEHYPATRESAALLRETLGRLQRGELDRAAFVRVARGLLEFARERDLLPEVLGLFGKAT